MGLLTVITVVLINVMGLLYSYIIIVSLCVCVFFDDDDECLLCIIRHIWMRFSDTKPHHPNSKNNEQKAKQHTPDGFLKIIPILPTLPYFFFISPHNISFCHQKPISIKAPVSISIAVPIEISFSITLSYPTGSP